MLDPARLATVLAVERLAVTRSFQPLASEHRSERVACRARKNALGRSFLHTSACVRTNECELWDLTITHDASWIWHTSERAAEATGVTGLLPSFEHTSAPETNVRAASNVTRLFEHKNAHVVTVTGRTVLMWCSWRRNERGQLMLS